MCVNHTNYFKCESPVEVKIKCEVKIKNHFFFLLYFIPSLHFSVFLGLLLSFLLFPFFSVLCLLSSESLFHFIMYPLRVSRSFIHSVSLYLFFHFPPFRRRLFEKQLRADALLASTDEQIARMEAAEEEEETGELLEQLREQKAEILKAFSPTEQEQLERAQRAVQK